METYLVSYWVEGRVERQQAIVRAMTPARAFATVQEHNVSLIYSVRVFGIDDAIEDANLTGLGFVTGGQDVRS